MAESTPAEELGAWAELPEDIVVQILVRLPARSLIRFRAVCKPWCRRVSERGFVVAHHRHQPPQPILSFIDDAFHPFLDFHAVDLNLRTGRRRMVAQFTHRERELVPSGEDLLFRVHASCDGFLLLNARGSSNLCNPATGRCAPLPLLRADEIKALYAHGPSGEYRVLYRRGDGLEKNYYALSVGKSQ